MFQDERLNLRVLLSCFSSQYFPERLTHLTPRVLVPLLPAAEPQQNLGCAVRSHALYCSVFRDEKAS